MAYDPKKKRPKTNPIDSVVDELFGDDQPKKAVAKKATKKTTSQKSTKLASTKTKPAKRTTTKSTSVKSDTTSKKVPVEPKAEKVELPDNVHQLPTAEESTPLIMQPHVWIATGIAALLVLFVAKRRKTR